MAENKLPIEHAKSEIAKAGIKDPFLYNPRLRSVQAGKVCRELVTLVHLADSE